MANILIVDDSKTSRRILKGILEGAGHTVIGEASNGEEGFIQYKQLKPDIVTMDITMPKMDGLEALKVIKHSFPEARIIMVSAAGQKSKVLEAIKEGAKEFISKPYNDEDILNVVKSVLQKEAE